LFSVNKRLPVPKLERNCALIKRMPMKKVVYEKICHNHGILPRVADPILLFYLNADPAWRHFEPLKPFHLNLKADLDKDLAFHSTANPDPASQNDADLKPTLPNKQRCGTVTILYGSGSGSHFWKVMVPVSTFKKVMVPVRAFEKLRFQFRFRFQLHI